MIVRSALDLRFPDVFLALSGYVDAEVYLKLEGFQLTGSIKLKTALFLVDDLEARGIGRPKTTTLVESSSGNLGAALAAVASARGYRFICVSDPNANPTNLRLIRAYGGEVVVVTERDRNGGYVETRLKTVHEIVATNPSSLWLNQYGNEANIRAHAETTAREITQQFPRVDWLFVGTGTTGTLMGCSQHFRAHSPKTTLVAVEPSGSVSFGGPARRRHIPGIGNSRVPELLDPAAVDRVVYVDERTTVRTCHEFARQYGLLLGGSSGTALAAMRSCKGSFAKDHVVVVISPDLGEKYLESIYDAGWVASRFGDALREEA